MCRPYTPIQVTVDGRRAVMALEDGLYIGAPLPQIVYRRNGEKIGDYAIRRAAAYIARDDARNIHDTTDALWIASMQARIDRAGFPPADGDALDAAQAAA